MTEAESTAAKPDEQPAPAPTQPRSWSRPKSPVSRTQADQIGRAAIAAVAAVGRSLAGVARAGARVIRRIWHAAQAVPPALQLFFGSAVLALLGIVGAIALHTTLGLICTVVVIPICAAILGALGYRWYTGLGAAAPGVQAAEPAESELMRSLTYVDRKLTTALTSFGTEHHQQAVIALFQAKTAVELTLGTEEDPANYSDLSLRPDDYGLRPRSVEPAARESNSLAAS